jgi:glucose/arabinose dehydrogenase
MKNRQHRLRILRYLVILAVASTGALPSAQAEPRAAPSRALGVLRTLLVSSGENDSVLRYDATSGAFIDIFASGGGLDDPEGLALGPDGHLYVTSRSNAVLRYHGTTGAFIDIFASGGGLADPAGLVFGPDGNLYVSSGETDDVKRFDGATGVFIAYSA